MSAAEVTRVAISLLRRDDGPYSDEIALADKLIGKVIGLYRPTGAMQ